ncbi:FAS1-like dehydratase domain-containing protein [Actinomadura atramentaria]|uniref:FAS1-like dehydratase domain-containing protein n=1 Tax=Actinomadura atramentaria TaxID=1990 RepID=UPI00037B51B1|nr:MaoC family dehydratase N-terminal domain-containing protein [Actinomadura atramentaria]
MIDVSGWRPEPRAATEVIGPGPAAALAGLLDVDPPDGELPPLWQWLYFLDRPAQRELGEDGHPRAGRFLPPIPDRRRMFAGGRLTVRSPLRFGDTVTRREELAGTAVKRGRTGELLFVTVRQTFLRDGEPVMTEEQDLVYRSGDPERPAPPQDGPPPEPDAPWSLRLTADPVLLFRFSALTYNAHRIHYDAEYATGAEGHPGLVVHGPLLAILCLELPRRAGHPVRELSFRARAPLHAGRPFAVAGSAGGDLAVLAPGGGTAMTAGFG